MTNGEHPAATRSSSSRRSKWLKKPRRRALLNRDGWTCAYCLSFLRHLPVRYVTIDHMLPGTNGLNQNLVACCRRCNLEKGRRDYTDFIASLRLPDWYRKFLLDRIHRLILIPIDLAEARRQLAAEAEAQP